MARTKQRTRIQGFIVTNGDVLQGEDLATGGALSLRGGNSTTGGNNGGNVLVSGGTNTNGTPGNTTGGSIVLTPGSGTGTGSQGLVTIGGSSALQFLEAASIPGPSVAAGEGRLWVRNDSPNVLVYTDDTGSDFVLNAGGSSAQSGSQGVPLTDLVAYVDIGDIASYPGTGTTVVDLAGNLTSGVISGAVYANGALDFDGTSGVLSFIKNASIDNIFSGGGTVMVFFRPRSDGEGNQGSLADTGYSAAGWTITTENELSADGGSVSILFKRAFSTTDGIWQFLGTDDATVRIIRMDSWNSIAITYDDSTTAMVPRIYVNGQIIPDAQINTVQAPVGTAVTDAGNQLSLGNNNAFTATYDGDLDVFLAWDQAKDIETIGAAHTVFAQRHGQHTGVGGQGSLGNDRKGTDVFLYAGDFVGTGQAPGGSVFIKGGATWSADNASNGGRIEIRGGDSRSTLDGSGNGGAAGPVLVVGGFGDLDTNTHTVGSLTQISSEFGGVTITSGNAGSRTLFRGTDNIGTGNPGATIVRGGDAYSGSGNIAGGAIGIRSGESRGSAKPNEIIIRSGGPSGTGSETGDIWITTQQANDAASIFGAVGDTLTDSGDIFIRTGPIGATANKSGSIDISTGDTNGSTGNSVGNITITAGSQAGSENAFVPGGSISLTAGFANGTVNAPGGDITLTAGAQIATGGGSGSRGGGVFVSAGDSASDDATNPGGPITISAGAGTGTSTPGGSVTISAGDNTNGTGTANGGDVVINAGDATGGGSTGNGGNIVLNPGSSGGSGNDGEVTINGKLTVTGLIDPTGLVLTAQSSNPSTPKVGDGTLWIRNDANQTLMFTDEGGSSFEVMGGGVRRMPEILLTPDNVSKTSTGTLASGLPNNAQPATHTTTEGASYPVQFLGLSGFGSTTTFYGMAWHIIIPESYSGNGLTVEVWITGESSGTGLVTLSAAFERQNEGFNVFNTSWGTRLAFMGTTTNSTAGVLVKGTVSFTQAQTGGLLAGEAARIAIVREIPDGYGGTVAFMKGRIFETP